LAGLVHLSLGGNSAHIEDTIALERRESGMHLMRDGSRMRAR
jgi:hypothetical protein